MQDVSFRFSTVTMPPLMTVNSTTPTTTTTPTTPLVKQNQTSAPVWLDRLDQDSLPLDGTYTYKETGLGVTVFLLDSVIRLTHQEFAGGRASCGYDAILGNESNIPCADLFGHGTNLAALVGGATVGAAHGVNIVMVKVGTVDAVTSAAVLAGIVYVLQQKKAAPLAPMVVVSSITGPRHKATNAAYRALVQAGVTVVASAGNGDKVGVAIDACTVFPAGLPNVVTVGAMDPRNDEVPYWSNNGKCVDIYAPGLGIYSAWKKFDTQYVATEGTSEAAPLVAAVAALYLQRKPTATPAEIMQFLKRDARKNILVAGMYDEGNSTATANITNNRLLHTGVFAEVPSPPKVLCPATGWKSLFCVKN